MRISDWSSDVCSSDLATGSAARPPTYPVDDSVRWLDASEAFEKLSTVGPGPVALIDPLGGPIAVALAEALAAHGISVSIVTPDSIVRSEERRVGKECVRTVRSRWSPST